MKRNGLMVSIFTNGTLINDTIVSLFKKWPPFKIEISLYGATKEIYESITRIKGSYRRCINGINLLVKNKLPLFLKTVLLTKNKDELSQMRDFTLSMGLDFRFDSLIHPKLNGSKVPVKFRLSFKEAASIDFKDLQKQQIYRKLFSDNSLKARTDPYLYDCMGGRTGFNIGPDGRLTICTLLRQPNYNLNEMSFKEAWMDLGYVVEEKYPSGYRCGSCNRYRLCRTCPALAHLETGDKFKPVEYLCNFANALTEVALKKL